jgi:hypothetical protein
MTDIVTKRSRRVMDVAFNRPAKKNAMTPSTDGGGARRRRGVGNDHADPFLQKRTPQFQGR